MSAQRLGMALAATVLLLSPSNMANAQLEEGSRGALDQPEPDTPQTDKRSVRHAPEQRPAGFIDARAGTVVIEDYEGEQAVAGYEPSPVNGFYVQSRNGDFRLQLGGYTQIRWNANWRTAPGTVEDIVDDRDFTRGWSMNRTRLFLEGKFTDRAAYHFRININDSYNVELLVAWAQIELRKRWSLRVGKQYIPLSREDWMYAQDVLTSEYSPNDFTFAIGPSLGVFAHYGGQQHRVWLAVHNGAFGGRDVFPQAEETDIAGTVRWEWNFVGDDWSAWNDMIGRRGRQKVMMLGISAAGQGSPGRDLDGTKAAGQLNFDLNFNGSGYQAVLAGSSTIVRPVGGSTYANFGLLAQVGVFVLDPLQLFTQYNLISPGTQPGNLESFNSLALGVNYFPFLWTNRWKLTLEGGVLFNALSNTLVQPSGSLGLLASNEAPQGYLRVQAQFGF